MENKADAMLTFLFWTVVGLMIFIPTCAVSAKFLKVGDKAGGSYNQLLSLASSIKDGELLSMRLYMDDNTAIIGISKNSNRFESKSSQGSATSVAYFEKPPECQSKTCICLCSELGYTNINILETRITCGKTPECYPFENIEFLKKRPLTDFTVPTDKLSKIDYWWENGFMIITQNKLDKTILAKIGFGGIENFMIKKEKTIYIHRKRNFVNVCYSQNCITDDIKKQIDIDESAALYGP